MVRPGFPVPEDHIESDAGVKYWINCVFYGTTILEVVNKRKDYFAQYPPQGYDTHTDGGVYKHPDGYYLIKVRRWSTCS